MLLRYTVPNFSSSIASRLTNRYSHNYNHSRNHSRNCHLFPCHRQPQKEHGQRCLQELHRLEIERNRNLSNRDVFDANKDYHSSHRIGRPKNFGVKLETPSGYSHSISYAVLPSDRRGARLAA